MDFPFTRTQEQNDATNAAAEEKALAHQRFLDTFTKITLREYALAQPSVCFDDSQEHTDEYADYEDRFNEVDFVISLEGELHSIAFVEMAEETAYRVWVWNHDSDEVLLGTFDPETTVHYV